MSCGCVTANWPQRRDRDALRQALPETIDIANPLDLRDDASSEHYLKALNVLLDSQDYDALLVIHSPSAAAPGTESALALIDALKHHPRGKYVTVLTNWCGEFSSQEARRLFSDAGCRPTERRKEPLPLLCIWWSTGVTRNSSDAGPVGFVNRQCRSAPCCSGDE
jgi:acyl-CoA synthetase (NDP forming)